MHTPIDKIRKLPMVRWFDPPQLLRTACDVATSTIIGQQADNRLVEALAGQSVRLFEDYSGCSDDFWVDYVSDAGDGWNSTYHVAHSLAQPKLELKLNDQSFPTKRGQVLVFGGDEVYPVANSTTYRERLIGPYQTALPLKEAVADVYAVPGNHDWYDGLVAFSRFFCSETDLSPGRRMGGWRTRQRRSYFALKLPRGWWLVGTDVQLRSDIDAPQVEYFRRIAEQMAPDDRVILCNAEPHWIYAKVYGRLDPEIDESSLEFLEKDIFKGRISIFLAGDLHHYRRHEGRDGKQKITAGGGGAFLHPTHGQDVAEIGGDYRLRYSYPPVEISRALTLRNLWFLGDNLSFGIVPALLYFLTAWSIKPDIAHLGVGDLGTIARRTWEAFCASPFSAFWVIALMLGLVLFTETHSKWYRWIAGSIHGLAHLLALFFISWSAAVLTSGMGWILLRPAVTGAIIFAEGWVIGSVIMGLYLLISLNVFGRHGSEAFSSFRCEDWKNFLRLCIGRDGSLTIYPVGIRRVAKRWKSRGSEDSISLIVPDDPAATVPELIEEPISLESSQRLRTAR